MDVIDLIRYEIRRTREWLDMTVSDITEEQANWQPPGVANTIGATYAHTIFAADEDFNQIYAGGRMLLRSGWADRCGLSELPPQEGQWDWSQWARRVRTDWPALQRYAAAVWETVEGYLDAVTYDDLRRDLDMSLWGLGTWKGLDIFLLHMHHPRIHGGEIACMKGMQGVPAWPTGWQSGLERPL
jgi:hypothetical protein